MCGEKSFSRFLFYCVEELSSHPYKNCIVVMLPVVKRSMMVYRTLLDSFEVPLNDLISITFFVEISSLISVL